MKSQKVSLLSLIDLEDEKQSEKIKESSVNLKSKAASSIAKDESSGSKPKQINKQANESSQQNYQSMMQQSNMESDTISSQNISEQNDTVNILQSQANIQLDQKKDKNRFSFKIYKDEQKKQDSPKSPSKAKKQLTKLDSFQKSSFESNFKNGKNDEIISSEKKKPFQRQLSKWADLEINDGKNNVKILKRRYVPNLIYVQNKEDLVKQLCSIGQKTFQCSHQKPFGDAANVKTLTDHEYRDLWASLKQENFDILLPFTDEKIPAVSVNKKKNVHITFKSPRKTQTQGIDDIQKLVISQNNTSYESNRIKKNTSNQILPTKTTKQVSKNLLADVSIDDRDEDQDQQENEAETSESEDNSDPNRLVPARILFQKKYSIYSRSSQRVKDWQSQIQARFDNIYQNLQSQKITDKKSNSQKKYKRDPISDEQIHKQEQHYQFQRFERIMKAPKLLGLNEINFSGSELRRQQARNSYFSSSNYWDKHGQPQAYITNTASAKQLLQNYKASENKILLQKHYKLEQQGKLDAPNLARLDSLINKKSSKILNKGIHSSLQMKLSDQESPSNRTDLQHFNQQSAFSNRSQANKMSNYFVSTQEQIEKKIVLDQFIQNREFSQQRNKIGLNVNENSKMMSDLIKKIMSSKTQS